ncbi:VCBS repeat-containing protein [Siphonobacter sp.]|uniref:VCBS repeat-containing protein n=1 Tax=Siphonobacter sp. TaxID=1869184 RepID=UPI003B3B1B76
MRDQCNIVLKVLIVASGFLLGLTACTSSHEKPLFETLDSTQTGIAFQNTVIDDDSLNIVEYLYFYNGAGVAAGDINNDGLTDLYFVSNRGKNKLYLNKGNWKFEDITEQAGVGGFADWQTGVSMADVNGDGWLDMYVCAVGNYRGLEGSNELYINNHDGTFTEKAAEYGLDFTGFSTQAAFFDYDHDGDLDCYLLNHAIHKAISYNNVNARFLRDNEAGDYLFENKIIDKGNQAKPLFVNVSEKAGIYGAPMGYGLGISVGDLDNDGWEDLYVSNDFHEDDYYYHNNGNGTFTEKLKETFAHTSRFSMGNDMADINNDGWLDVMTLDMYPEDETVEKSSAGEDAFDVFSFKLSYGYHYQYARNCLQLNLQGKRFVDIAAQLGMAATDWSWAPLWADYDGDGVKDVFITNGIVRRPNNMDYIKYVFQDSVYAALDKRVKDAVRRSIQHMPEGKTHNYLYQGVAKGPFDFNFKNRSADWGFAKENISNGAVYADLDNDGDLDLISNDINEAAGVYRNTARQTLGNHYLKVKFQGEKANVFGIGVKVLLRDSTQLFYQQNSPVRGFQSSVEPTLTFGLGKQTVIDSLLVIWPDGKSETLRNVKTDQNLTLRYTSAQNQEVSQWWKTAETPVLEEVQPGPIPYTHYENKDYFDFSREPLMPFQLSTEGPRLARGDVNGDGLEDIYIPGAKLKVGQLFTQKPDGQFVRSMQPAFDADSSAEHVAATFFDADGDGDLDLYVVAGGNEYYGEMGQLQDLLYFNDGKGSFTKASTALPKMLENKSGVYPADFDKDGDIDLFVSGRVTAYAYGKPPRSFLLVNDGKGNFSDQTDRLAPELRLAGLLTDAHWSDFDGDQKPDLLVIGDWMEPQLFVQKGGKFSRKPIRMEEADGTESTRMKGFWSRMAWGDLNKDGREDGILGNLGLNSRFRRKGSNHLKMWVKDIDSNGQAEQILAYEDQSGSYYPLAGKDELGKQLPSVINKKFTTYADFAGKTVEDIFNKGELNGATEFEINRYSSVWLENKGDLRFVIHELPAPAQWSKLYAFAIGDVDGNGTPDVLTGGNLYSVNPAQGQYNANPGLILFNDGKGNFRASPGPFSGFSVSGEIRDIQALRTAAGTRWLVSRNNDRLLVFKTHTHPIQ